MKTIDLALTGRDAQDLRDALNVYLAVMASGAMPSSRTERATFKRMTRLDDRLLRVQMDTKPKAKLLAHTVRGKSDGPWPYGTTHDADCPACLASGESFTSSPRSETYWAS